MSSEVESAELQVRRAIVDSLRASAGGFDVRSAEDTIIDYVFRRKPPPTEANRYEWFYSVMGMAVSIAQGWRDNHAAGAKPGADVSVGIKSYIEKTYGVNYADYP